MCGPPQGAKTLLFISSYRVRVHMFKHLGLTSTIRHVPLAYRWEAMGGRQTLGITPVSVLGRLVTP